MAQLATGATPASVAGPSLRVVDTAGQPVDGGPALPLSGAQVRELAGGEAIVAGGPDGLRRWIAEPAVLPDGSPRLVIVTGDVIGGTTLIARAAAAFVLGALGAALVVGCAAWLGTRAALRPVDRMRAAAAALPPGERLPVPMAHDELRALTEELNRLLARRDEAAARLERFTGDAAHELRSPVAAIRAQAEVAVAHPDPQMAEETLRARSPPRPSGCPRSSTTCSRWPGPMRARARPRSPSTWSPRPGPPSLGPSWPRRRPRRRSWSSSRRRPPSWRRRRRRSRWCWTT